jgi:hypothetical protein
MDFRVGSTIAVVGLGLRHKLALTSEWVGWYSSKRVGQGLLFFYIVISNMIGVYGGR